MPRALFFTLLLASAAAQAAPVDKEAMLERCSGLASSDPAAAMAMVKTEMATPQARSDASYGANLVVCRGFAQEHAGRNDLAMADYETGVSEGRRLKDQRLLALALALRGDQNGVRGLYADAIVDLKAAYDIEQSLGRANRMVTLLNSIANLYADRNVKDYDNALAYYRRALATHEASANLQGQSAVWYNIGATLESQEKLDEALKAFQRGLDLDRKRGVKDEIANDERSVAVVLSKLGRHEDALRLLDHAMSLYPKDADPFDIAALRLSRGVALRRAGRFALALPDLDAARAFFLSQKNLRFLEKIHDERGLALAGLGDWREAFGARGEYQEVRQKLQEQLLDERSSRLRVQFDTEQQKIQNRALVRENELAQRELRSVEAVRQWQMAALALSLVAIAALAILMGKQVKLGRAMRDLAMTDELTRLPNRRHFMAVAEGALAHATSANEQLAVAALDIDFFKKVNDTYGHAAGDLLLQRVAHAMRAALRPGDTVGRTGGEEFIALMRGAGEDDARAVAERLRAAVEALDCSDISPALKPTISIGLAARKQSGDKLDLLCKRADDALYRAKENGRNRVES